MDRGAVIIDDHALFAGGMKLLLESMNRFGWVDISPQPDRAITTNQNKAVELIVLDYFIPGFQFSDWCPKLLQAFPGTRLIAVSSSPSRSDRSNALTSGADAFFEKHTPPSQVLPSLEALLEGEALITEATQSSPSSAAANAGLSPRQIEILIRLARGQSAKEIAHEFSISAETVKSHLSNIYQRTGAAGKSAAIQWARDLGLT